MNSINQKLIALRVQLSKYNSLIEELKQENKHEDVKTYEEMKQVLLNEINTLLKEDLK